MATISPQAWKSHKLKRKCAHQFGAEVLAISEGLAAAEFARVMWQELTHADFDLRQPYQHAGEHAVISVTDPKGGYDHIVNPKSGMAEDRRSAIDAAIVRDSMKRPGVRLRWIEGFQQLPTL